MNRASSWTRKLASAVFLLAILAWGASSEGMPATVRGVIIKGNGAPAANDQVHLENRVTGNLYVTATGDDGSFSVEVPPGWYDLRERNGAVIKRAIRVNLEPLDIGSVTLPKKGSFWRLFQRERLAPVLVESPAPTTVSVPPDSRIPKVTRPESTGASHGAIRGASSGEGPRTSASANATQRLEPMPSAAGSSSAAYSTRLSEDIPPPVKPNYVPPVTPLAAPSVQ